MKLSPSTRTVLLVAFLAAFATGCSGDSALLWHYWLAVALMAAALLVVFVVMPLGYYVKVWRLRHRGRRVQ